jgi:hypothetical protein
MNTNKKMTSKKQKVNTKNVQTVHNKPTIVARRCGILSAACCNWHGVRNAVFY